MDDKQLIARYAPVFALHHDEKYYPISVEDFLSVAEVRVRKSGDNAVVPHKKKYFDEVAIPSGALTNGDLAELGKRHPDQNVQLDIPEEHWGGAKAEEMDGVPIYAVLKRVYEPGEMSSDSIEAIEINYTFLCCYNGPYKVFCFKTGEHVADWEHVTVRLDPDGELEGIYYSSHKNYEGDWKPVGKVPMRDGRPLVYLARDGHGCYSRPGVHFRVFGFANDICSDKGVLWKPQEVRQIEFQDGFTRSRGTTISKTHYSPFEENLPGDNINVIDEEGEWLDFRGFWGKVTNPTQQIWFRGSEDPTTWGGLKRCFCPCAPRPEVVYK